MQSQLWVQVMPVSQCLLMENVLHHVIKCHLCNEGMEIQLICKYFNRKYNSFNETTELTLFSYPHLPSLQDALLLDG